MGELKDNMQLFEDKKIRTAWDAEKEEWYFSIVDVVGVLTDQPDTRHASTYWAVLKNRLASEGANELLTNCKQLKMRAADGKRRLTDVADTQQLLRIIQSIPSPKAEPLAVDGNTCHNGPERGRLPAACYRYRRGRGSAAGNDRVGRR